MIERRYVLPDAPSRLLLLVVGGIGVAAIGAVGVVVGMVAAHA